MKRWSISAPTPYPQVNATLDAFQRGLQEVLGELLVGIYLHGSLATGDFNPQSSDLDFVVVVTTPITEQQLPALAEMHKGLLEFSPKWAARLEGAYIAQQILRHYLPGETSSAWLGSDGHFAIEPLGSDWVIQSYVIREHGIVLFGPDPKTLIDPISPDDLRRAEQATLRYWWAPQLENPVRLVSREYQAYAALTMCRALYLLEFGTVVSKPVVAKWAIAQLEPYWKPLIERSLIWYEGDGVDDKREALELIRYTLDRAFRSITAG